MLVLLCGCTAWILTKRPKQKARRTRMQRVTLNKSLKQHSANQQLYSHLPSDLTSDANKKSKTCCKVRRIHKRRSTIDSNSCQPQCRPDRGGSRGFAKSDDRLRRIARAKINNAIVFLFFFFISLSFYWLFWSIFFTSLATIRFHSIPFLILTFSSLPESLDDILFLSSWRSFGWLFPVTTITLGNYSDPPVVVEPCDVSASTQQKFAIGTRNIIHSASN